MCHSVRNNCDCSYVCGIVIKELTIRTASSVRNIVQLVFRTDQVTGTLYNINLCNRKAGLTTSTPKSIFVSDCKDELWHMIADLFNSVLSVS
jgi:hypothetical protein